MRVYTCNDFRGVYPVGTAAVVIAPNRNRALQLFLQELKRIGLEQSPEDFSLLPLSNSQESVTILRDGDY